jgi:hypothetical protein
VHHGPVGIWRRKLKGRAGKVTLAVMFGLQVLHGEVGDPMLLRLPKPAEPYAADWERSETRVDVEGISPLVNSSPAVTGAPRVVAGRGSAQLGGLSGGATRTINW